MWASPAALRETRYTGAKATAVTADSKVGKVCVSWRASSAVSEGVSEEEAARIPEGVSDDEGAGEAAPSDGSQLVPDVRGLSARAALRLLDDRGFGAELTGSGRAVRQKPTAGLLVKPGTLVQIELDGT